MANIESIHALNDRMKYFVDLLAEQTSAFGVLIDEKSSLDRDIARIVSSYIDANPDAKKISWEKLELVACKKAEEKEQLFHLIWLRSKVKLGEIMLESTKTGISAVQTQMKFANGYIPYKGHDGKPE